MYFQINQGEFLTIKECKNVKGLLRAEKISLQGSNIIC